MSYTRHAVSKSGWSDRPAFCKLQERLHLKKLRNRFPALARARSGVAWAGSEDLFALISPSSA